VIIPTVFLCLLATALTWRRVRSVRRRRDLQTMVVTSCPDIELRQCYGGWDADAYDAHSGRDRSWAPSVNRAAYADRPVGRRTP
jgi:hypothetical protein